MSSEYFSAQNSAPSQIAERQLAYFQGKHLLVAGEIEDQFPLHLQQECQSVSVFTTHYGYYRQIADKQEITAYFGATLDDNCHADMVLLYWPKAKQEAEYLLAMLMTKLGPGTEIVVVGENRSGVKSIEKLFQPYGIIRKYDSARRCSFYWGECHQAPDTFNIQDWFKTYSVHYRQQEIIVKSLPGVFSHGEFDLGSQLLLDNLPEMHGEVLDFGCGAGVIGSVIAAQHPSVTISMCDVSALAIESSKATLAANGLKGLVFPSDIYSDITGTYDHIISNPPFHSGLDTSYHATETLLAQAPQYLTPRGTLSIVANGFLKYPPLIERAFGHCQTVAKTNKFAIYQASR
ncbi:16S rRNA (guanine(1207)-N(2))-methyltransferase RsmC [Vibrio mangrovi]|uniref:Ribosomal RNA small subunit methyltransferase C n=1 Tax=Vibrio mangrovi TaxID=474394 RepID=A0A1Y6IUF6_9VIBR|nr:16S rRNA (guanine(1207)-N(2))-methyltransferase RsmC [Vibrio mangrovi]MDW6003053.1 16S rRNA (guanine(1207)-N(2))-methyltransferase RsmC [Vibrio mangrovi]SMS01295.1 Ribosomal RNA small subunit methyltransferase C [Vibrio mangrovi]